MRVGDTMRARLNELKPRIDCIVEVRGLGAMTAVEFCRHGDPHPPAPEIANAL